MRSTLILLFLLTVQTLAAQLFPIRVDNRWGLIDADGSVVVSPSYNAIGEFKEFGFAVMQRGDGVGLLDATGREALPPRYEDVKVLSADLISVMQDRSWRVINLQQQTIVPPGYERLELLDEALLAHRREGRWGVLSATGEVVAPPQYDAVALFGDRYLRVTTDKKQGLLDRQGNRLLLPRARRLRPPVDGLIFFQENELWGAIDSTGAPVLPVRYEQYQRLSRNYYELHRGTNRELFVTATGHLIRESYDGFFPLNEQFVVVQRGNSVGLIRSDGDVILPGGYAEIRLFGENTFRVRMANRWGLVDADNAPLLPMEYSYVAPLQGEVAVLRRGRHSGLLNRSGALILPAEFSEIEREDRRISAYRGEALSVYELQDDGSISEGQSFKKHLSIRVGGTGRVLSWRSNQATEDNSLILEHFEWFYEAGTKKWGLRRLDDGTNQIEPTYRTIRIEREHGFTLVGMEEPTRAHFEHTKYMFAMAYGLVKNEVGLLISDIELLDVRFDDFDLGLPVARVVLQNGRHGLLDKVGRIIRRDYAYIGDFYEGWARFSTVGRLSGRSEASDTALMKLNRYLGTLESASTMTDFTAYDQDFEFAADLMCEDCQFGYLDTLGNVVVSAAYRFARDRVNGVGIVLGQQGWGMLDGEGREVLPTQYDQLGFLERTDKQVVRLYRQTRKYGLMDTLGNVRVRLEYDDLRHYREDRLAVRCNQQWGFVDRSGTEIIPCRYRQVRDFSNGLAAVKLNGKWGFIDQYGEEVLPFDYEDAGSFVDGLAYVQVPGSYHYIDRSGQVVVPGPFDAAEDFDRGVARVREDQRWGLIDATGKWVTRPRFISIQPFNQHGLSLVKYGNERTRTGILNLAGSIITNGNYRTIKPYYEGLAAVQSRDGWGFVDTLGQIVVKDSYSKVRNFFEGRAAVMRRGKWGYIDGTGTEIVAPQYNRVSDFKDRRAVVQTGRRRTGLIDRSGTYIIEPGNHSILGFSDGRGLARGEDHQFYYITEQARLYDGYYERAQDFQHGLAAVRRDGRWGYVNSRGIEVVPPRYDRVGAFEFGYAKVRTPGFTGLATLSGDLLLSPDYEYVSYAGSGLFRVERGSTLGYLSTDGTWVWRLEGGKP